MRADLCKVGYLQVSSPLPNAVARDEVHEWVQRQCDESQERSTKLYDIHVTHARTLSVTAYYP